MTQFQRCMKDQLCLECSYAICHEPRDQKSKYSYNYSPTEIANLIMPSSKFVVCRVEVVNVVDAVSK